MGRGGIVDRQAGLAEVPGTFEGAGNRLDLRQAGTQTKADRKANGRNFRKHLIKKQLATICGPGRYGDAKVC